MGKLIVIEGLDGSGKNTQAKLLQKYFSEIGIKSKYVSFPNYDYASSTLVKMYQNSEFGSDPNSVNAYAASSFYAVDRYASFKKFWETEYNNGYTIVCDRYTTSNAIYQMCKLPRNDWEEYLNWLFDYEYNKLELPKPDKVIYLEVPLEISQSLLSKRYMGDETQKDIYESNLDFLEKCQKAADYVYRCCNWEKINCVDGQQNIKSIDKIHSDLIGLLSEV